MLRTCVETISSISERKPLRDWIWESSALRCLYTMLSNGELRKRKTGLRWRARIIRSGHYTMPVLNCPTTALVRQFSNSYFHGYAATTCKLKYEPPTDRATIRPNNDVTHGSLTLTSRELLCRVPKREPDFVIVHRPQLLLKPTAPQNAKHKKHRQKVIITPGSHWSLLVELFCRSRVYSSIRSRLHFEEEAICLTIEAIQQNVDSFIA